jgi:hypothetical protein
MLPGSAEPWAVAKQLLRALAQHLQAVSGSPQYPSARPARPRRRAALQQSVPVRRVHSRQEDWRLLPVCLRLAARAPLAAA